MNFIVKLLFSFLILGLVFYKIDLAAVSQHLSTLSFGVLLLSLFFQLLSTLVASYRWNAIMRAAEAAFQPTRFYVRSFFKGSFINQGLPTTLGGDALRVVELTQRTGDRKGAFFGVLLDRLIGLSGLFLLNLLLLPISREIFPSEIFYGVQLVSGGCLLAAAIALAIPVEKIAALMPERLQRLFRILTELSGFARDVLVTHHSLLLQCFLALTIHIFSILSIYVLAQALGVAFPLTVFMVILPSVIIVASLPISISGWGVREGSMVALFALVGADKSAILAASICYGLIYFVSNLPGLWFFLVDKKTQKSE
jgi:uncharacterized protein (TIRG00374 family)